MIVACSFLCALFLLTAVSGGGGGETTRGKWVVKNATDGSVCILFNAEIKLKLSYYKREPDEALADVEVTVPAAATLEGSSCGEEVTVSDGSASLHAQVIQLNFPLNPGWNVRMAFSRDKRLDLDDDEFTLFQVNVTANYSSMLDKFDIETSSARTHSYYQPVDLANPPDIATNMFTKVGHSLYCPSKQAFFINNDEHLGPAAIVYFDWLQMQAFRTQHSSDFGSKDTCPADQRELDLVPVIISAVLALFSISTLIIYLVYRSRLPSEIINLTVPEGDENKAFEEEHPDRF